MSDVDTAPHRSRAPSPSTAVTGLVLVAGGRGLRLGPGDPKAFRRIGGRTLLQHAVAAALASGVVRHLVVVVPAELVAPTRGDLLPAPPAGSGTGPAVDATGRGCVTIDVVAGGAERTDSVRAGLRVLPLVVDVVHVHDAARALAPPGLFARVDAAIRSGAAAVVPGLPLADTVKEVQDGVVVGTPDRSRLVAVQTPQCFRRSVLERAHRTFGDIAATDDAGLVERLGVTVEVVEGDEAARKITRPGDLLWAEAMLATGGPG